MSAWSNSKLPITATRRQVVHELGPLVEERRVVLVALDHERLAGSQPVAAAEVERHSADQERRVLPRALQQEGDEARGGGLAVRARHHQRAALAQERLGQERGLAGVALAPVEHRLDLGVAARERVPDHHQVGVARHVRLRVGRAHVDSERLELGGHRRVDVLVRAGDAVAPLAQQACERRHRRSADGAEVDLHSTGASSILKRASPLRHSSLAFTPNGSVRFGCAVWPLDSPSATGTSIPSSASSSTSSRR